MTPYLEPVLAIPAVLLLAVLFLLATPVTISFSIVRREAFSARITIGWLFGLLRFTPSLARSGDRAKRRRRRRPVAAPPEPDDSSGEAPSEVPSEVPPEAPRVQAKRFRRLLKSKGFVRGVLRFLRDMARCVRFVSLRVAGRIGLDDPCDTGRLWGSICAVTGFLHGAKRVRFLVEPEFNEAVFELDGQGEIRIVPVTLLLPTVRFVLSPATLRAAWAASRRTRRTGRSGRPRRSGRTGRTGRTG